MKRKLSWFLIVCLLAGIACPQTHVYAVEQMGNAWQMEENVEEKSIEELTEENNKGIEYIPEEKQNGEVERVAISSNSLAVSDNFLEDADDMLETASVTLTQADIPDSVLWDYLVENYGKDGELTTEDMSKIQTINIPINKGMVSDLKGIEYATDLKFCYMQDHQLTYDGVLPLLTCANLKTINLQNNKITKMPDFSSMLNLSELNISENFIPVEEITEDKYPAGLTSTEFWRQNLQAEIEVRDNRVYKDATESGTYGFSLTLTGVKNYVSQMEKIGIKIIDKTAGLEEVLFEESDVDFTQQYISTTDYCNSAYNYRFDISEVTMIPGERNWEIVCTIEETNTTDIITEELTVTVDSEGVGGFQEVPDEILPRELADYWINYSYNQYDKNKDGMISFIELGDITYFYWGYGDDTSIELDCYTFLSYMDKLNSFSLYAASNFTQENLSLLTNLRNLSSLSLYDAGNISDISVLKEVYKLQYLSLYGATDVKGLTELKNKKIPIEYIYADEGTFSDADIFDYIFVNNEASVAIGHGAELVLNTPIMQSTKDIEITVSENDILCVSEENPFYVYGTKIGETSITYTLGESSYTVQVEVTGTPWDSDPELGSIVDSDKRMRFAGSEGVVSARASHTMIDGEENIWNISTRVPKMILEKEDYTKYAARLMYARTNIFSTETTTSYGGNSLYLDNQGTLWLYDKTYSSSEDVEFCKNRYEIMQNVQDWQEGGYTEDNYYIYRDAYILILKKDGSLWYCDFYERGAKDPETEKYYYYLKPNNLEKLEDDGVTAVYPNAYLKEGTLYRVAENGENFEVAENIVQVWDSNSIILAQDSEGNYYTTQGETEVTGTVKEFLVSNCWDSGYLQETEPESYIFIPTERDMIASYLLMEDGKLYRSIYSRDITKTDFVLIDSDVTALEKDYYWKDNQCFWFTGEKYSDYIGNGAGKGLYPVWEIDADTGIGSITLYVHGIPYLTKVSDWTIAEECIYAVRLDNTLWQFDDENPPAQIELNSTKKEIGTQPHEIQILDLKKEVGGVQIEWSKIEGASSYRIDTTSETKPEKWIMVGNTVNEYFIVPYTDDKCYYMIQALDDSGTVIADSWKYYSVNGKKDEYVSYGMEFALHDEEGNEIKEEKGIYTIFYEPHMEGQKLYLDPYVEGLESPKYQVLNTVPAVAEASVCGQRVEITIKKSGTTRITVQETATGCNNSIYLTLKEKETNTKPKVKITVQEKLNLFYTDTKAVYHLSPNIGTISKVEFVPNKGTENYFWVSFDSKTNMLSFSPKSDVDGKSVYDLKKGALSKALKGTLKITIGKVVLTQKLTIAKTNQTPQIYLSENFRKVYKFTTEDKEEPVYVGTNIEFDVIAKNTKEIMEDITVYLTKYKTVKKGVTSINFKPGYEIGGAEEEYFITKNGDGKYTMTFTGKSNSTAVIEVKGRNWTKPIQLKYNVKVTTAKLKGKLSASKIILNKNYDGDEKSLTLTTNLPYTGFTLGEWEVTKMPRLASDASALTLKKVNSGLKFGFLEEQKETLAEGNYMIKIPVTFKFEEGVSYTPQPIYLKVNVINQELTKKNIKWKKSGALDVLSREYSEMSLEPVISGINGKLVDVEFSDTDKANGMDQKFIMDVKDGILKIQLKSNVAVSTKEKNEIYPILTVATESGKRYTLSETPKISIKLTQSSVKIIPNRKSLTMYLGYPVTWNQWIGYEQRAVQGAYIERIESATEGFEAKLFENGRVQLKLTDTNKKAKSYTVKMDVYLKGQATNKKPIKMQVKVVLKK